MSADIYGYAGRQAAWWLLNPTTDERVTGGYLTYADGQSLANLDFDVFKSQLHDGLGRTVDAWGIYRWNHADKMAKAAGKAVFLGAVGENYEIIQHHQGFRLIDALMMAQDGAHYETMGALGKGETVWGLADLKLGYSIGDDAHKTYLMIVTAHDGSMSFQLTTCDERVVCRNTLRMALGERARACIKISHTKNCQVKIDDAERMIRTLAADVSSIEEKMNILASRKASRETVTGLFDRLFPRKKGEDGEVLADSTRRENIITDILTVYESNDNNAFPEQRGTLYNLLNAVTNYTDFSRSTKGDVAARATSAVFGSGDKLKNQTLTYLMDASRGSEMMPAHPVYITDGESTGSSLLDGVIASTVK